MTRASPSATVFFLSDFGTAGRVRRGGPRRHRAACPGDDRHRPDPPHPALRRPRREPHPGAGRAPPRRRGGARRRRSRGRHGPPRRRPGGRAARPAGTLCFVGPDNGLLVAAAEAAGEAPVAAWWSCAAAAPARTAARPSTGATSSPRPPPPCAPGRRSRTSGEPVDPASLVRLVGGVVEQGRLHDGRACLRAEVTWVDRFGNLQLAATVADAAGGRHPVGGQHRAGGPTRVGRARTSTGCRRRSSPTASELRCVDAFGELAQGELGLLVDANGHLAVVAGEASAAELAQRRRRGAARPGLVSGPARAPGLVPPGGPRYHPTQ